MQVTFLTRIVRTHPRNNSLVCRVRTAQVSNRARAAQGCLHYNWSPVGKLGHVHRSQPQPRFVRFQ